MILRGAFSRLGLRTRDQFQWVQIGSDELPLGLSLASDGNRTGFKWDQIKASYPRIRLGPLKLRFRCSEWSSQSLIGSRGFDWHHGCRGFDGHQVCLGGIFDGPQNAS